MGIRVCAAVAVVGVSVAGCGGSSSGGSISPASYRTKVNALCAANNAKIKALPAGTENSIAGLEKEAGIATATLAQIKAVAAPSSLSSHVKSWIGVLDQEEVGIETILADIRGGKAAQAELTASKAQTLATQGNLAASKLGLTACAADVQASGS